MVAIYDLKYPTPSGELLFDAFSPDLLGPKPAVVLIHGGGWISGEKSMMEDVAVGLAAQGYAAFCPQYRLAPLHPFPAAVEDVQSFVAFLRGSSGELQIAQDKIASLGNSAGGHLAAMLGLTDVPVGGISTRVNAVVDICGISDLTQPHGNHFPIAMSFLEQFMGGPFEGRESLWRKASPIEYVDTNAAPFLIIHGDADDVVPVGQSDALAGKLFAAGVPVTLHKIPGEGHSFSYSGWEKIERLFSEFLGRNLKSEVVV